jgi:hypothetical protein
VDHDWFDVDVLVYGGNIHGQSGQCN